MDTRERILNLMENNHITKYRLAKEIKVSSGIVSDWANGKSTSYIKYLDRIADYFGVTVDFLVNGSHNTVTDSKINSVRIPVLGYVAAGMPLEAIENIVDWEEIPQTMAEKGNYFGLVINGSSMEPRMCKGDVVIVRKQPDIESGEIGIVLVDGERATCKKVVKHENGISLVPFNQAYEIMFYTWQEAETLPITIIGKVVELRGKF